MVSSMNHSLNLKGDIENIFLSCGFTYILLRTCSVRVLMSLAVQQVQIDHRSYNQSNPLAD